MRVIIFFSLLFLAASCQSKGSPEPAAGGAATTTTAPNSTGGAAPAPDAKATNWVGEYEYQFGGEGQFQIYTLTVLSPTSAKMRGDGFQLMAEVEYRAEQVAPNMLILHYDKITEDVGIGMPKAHFEEQRKKGARVCDTLSLENGKWYWASEYRNGGKAEVVKK